jgi:hypothetical protein
LCRSELNVVARTGAQTGGSFQEPVVGGQAVVAQVLAHPAGRAAGRPDECAGAGVGGSAAGSVVVHVLATVAVSLL